MLKREMQRIFHEIPPIFDDDSEILILGTMPSPKSREAAFYYMHPQNRFWRVMGNILDEDFNIPCAERKAILLRRHIALWDVLKCCDIDKASDASIKNAQPNDLSIIFNSARIKKVFTTGAAAFKYYKKYFNDDCVKLYSPSAANCAISFDKLCDNYRQILEYLND